MSEIGSWPGAVDTAVRELSGISGDASYRTARWLFLRGLGLAYLTAFASLWRQLDGLLGADGILPAAEYLERIRRPGRGVDLAVAPTLFWWRSDDRTLHAACGVGVVLSAALVLGVAPAAVLFLLWVLYLSFASVGQVFLSYQWDVLLLEAGFLATCLAPWAWLAAPWDVVSAPVPTPALLVLWWLLFRLVFQSGVGKLTSGDPAWWDLSALEYHWWTQPLPTRLAWWMDELPGWFHRGATLATHLLEVGLPVLIFVPGPGRPVAFTGIVGLQLLIFATGNYNFFNLLTMALAVLLLEDATWAHLLPFTPPGAEGASAAAAAPGALQLGASVVLLAAVLVVSVPRLLRTATPDGTLPPGVQALLRRADPWRTINSYGLFRVMTKRRPEIVVQGSRDGERWRDYTFRWKPGDPSRPPRLCAPHQPRLDWQMWFAALGDARHTPWFHAFIERLLEGSAPVEGLLEETPFGEDPPEYVRALIYDYRFTDREARRRTGRWWTRELRGLYAPPTRLPDGNPRG